MSHTQATGPTTMISSGIFHDEEYDGYRLVRLLGEGGFGQVWLCRSGTTGAFHALKFVPGSDPEKLEKETASLLRYRQAASGLRSPYLTPIEHAGRAGSGLFYIMPLADGLAEGDPEQPHWQPRTLGALIRQRLAEGDWFSSEEVIAIIRPVLLGLQTLSDAGLVHRDVKPENVLFFGGVPCLADISLLGSDAEFVTRRGTPGYATPSWYGGGHPDMYGAAATLYTLLTGNDPDKMGRSAFRWPPRGEKSLTAAERSEWMRLHGVIRRATEERVSERYTGFCAMSKALAPLDAAPVRTWRLGLAASTVVGVGAMVVLASVHNSGPGRARIAEAPAPSPTAPSSTALPEIKPVEVPPPARPSPPAPPVEPNRSTTNDTVSSPVPRPVVKVEVHRSPRNISKGSHAAEDAGLALNSLAFLATQPDTGLAEETTARFAAALDRVRDQIRDPRHSDYSTAVGILDKCLASSPDLERSGNARLAILLLAQCAGDSDRCQRSQTDPSFATLGSDNLSYRVELLARLAFFPAANQILAKCLAEDAATPGQRAFVLMEDARHRCRFADYEAASIAVRRALELVAEEPSELALRQAELLELERDSPGFALFLRAQTGK